MNTDKLTTKDIFNAHVAASGPRPEKGADGYTAWMKGYWQECNKHAKAGTRAVAVKTVSATPRTRTAAARKDVKLGESPFTARDAARMAVLRNWSGNLDTPLADCMRAHGYTFEDGMLVDPVVVVRAPLVQLTPEQKEAIRLAVKRDLLAKKLADTQAALAVATAKCVEPAPAAQPALVLAEPIVEVVTTKKGRKLAVKK